MGWFLIAVFLLGFLSLISSYWFGIWFFIGGIVAMWLSWGGIKEGIAKTEREMGRVPTPSFNHGEKTTFEYADANGEYTKRTVEVHSVNERYLEGFCQLRNDYRTFRRDRILSGKFSL